MSRMDFYIVDVFTIGRKYTGNQLAVYLGDPPTDLMQQLAKEINFSEITFVTSNTPEHGGIQCEDIYAGGRSALCRAPGSWHRIRDPAGTYPGGS